MYDQDINQADIGKFVMHMKLKIKVQPYQKMLKKDEKILTMREISLDLLVKEPAVKKIRIGREESDKLNDEIAPKIILPFQTISKNHGELEFYFKKAGEYMNTLVTYFDNSSTGTWICLDDPEYIENPEYQFLNKNRIDIEHKAILYFGAKDLDYSDSIYQVNVEWE